MHTANQVESRKHEAESMGYTAWGIQHGVYSMGYTAWGIKDGVPRMEYQTWSINVVSAYGRAGVFGGGTEELKLAVAGSKPLEKVVHLVRFTGSLADLSGKW